MKTALFALFALMMFVTFSFADEYVHGYTRRDGTQVDGYHRSSPNGTVTDNYSYKGNTNPYTGSQGTDTYRSSPSSPYYDGSSSRRR